VRSRVVTTSVALAAAGAMALTSCSSSKGGGGNNTGGLGGGNSGGNSANKTYKIGFIGALSGDSAQLGINEHQGAELAIEQANQSNKYNAKFKLVAQDSEGDPAKAPAAATALISDPQIIATIGPAFSGESEAVNPSFCGASPPMPIVTASASKGTLQTHGWKCWHRIIPNDNVEGTQGADWLARKGVHKVFVLDDGTPYGEGVASTMTSELKAKGVKVQTGRVPQTTTKNYDPIANTIVNSGADALFYGGYDAYTALLAKSLQSAGFNGLKVTGNGSKDSTFTKNAGPAGNGWYFTCGCQDATKAPTAKAFTAAYKARWHEDPSTYSPEAYDAANLIMDAISKAAANGTPTRTSVLAAINNEDYQGITTTIKFQANGEVVPSNLIVNLFQEKNGVITGLGNIKELK
jgi:branched-chain amino acid transport system substrate-binding protein